MKKDVVLLNHYDLDASSCYIIAHHMYNVIESKNQGYAKVPQALDYLINKYADSVDTIVISDLSMEEETLVKALDNFNEVILYDHHLPSANFEVFTGNLYDYPTFKYHYTDKMSATAIMYQDYLKQGGERTQELDDLVKYTNAYDMWKSDTPEFWHGVSLNFLFWENHLWEFAKRFEDGFDGLTSDEKAFCNRKLKEVDDSLKSADKEKINDDLKIYIMNDTSSINFVTLKDNDAQIFIILYQADSEDKEWCCSVRSTCELFNVNDALQKVEKDDIIMSTGGHKAAGGITFVHGTTLEQILEKIEQLLEDGIFEF